MRVPDVSRPPHRIGDHEIPPGTLRRLRLPVARLPSDTEVSLPVAVVHGARPGPAVWVAAAIHGDELNGVPIIQRLLTQVNPAKLRGTLVTVPIVNVFGLINESRYLPDGRDLNRCFPGSRTGSLAARLAYLFMNEVVSGCAYGIDLHTASDGRTNLPQIRANLGDPETLAASLAFGAPVVVDAKERAGSLRHAAVKAGTRVLVYEAGEAGRFWSRAVELGTLGVLRVLAHLGMIKRAPGRAPSGRTVQSASTSWTRSPRSGFCQLVVGLGDHVEKGQGVAHIFDALGSKEYRVNAGRSGIVIGHLQGAVVHRGDALVHIAEVSATV